MAGITLISWVEVEGAPAPPPVVGTGVLTSSTAAQTANGVSSSPGTAILAAGTGALSGAGVSRVVATGDLLAGVARNNLLLQSQTLDVAPWAATNAVVSADAIAAPDLTVTAERVADNAVSGSHQLYQAVSVPSAGVYTYSVYAKPDTLQLMRLQMAGPGGSCRANFNLATGAITSIIGGPLATGAEALANGWYRFYLTFNAAVGATTFYLPLLSNAALTSYVGTGQAVYLWGGQLELSSVPTAYTPTTTTQVINASTAPTLAGAGLSSSRSTSTALVAQSNFLQLGSGISSTTGTGTLTSGFATGVGLGSVNIPTGTGTLVAGGIQPPAIAIDNPQAGVWSGVGNNTVAAWHGQSFLAEPAFSLGAITLNLKKVGSPTDNLVVRVYSDPGTTLLVSSDPLAGSVVGTTEAEHTFSFPSVVNFAGGTTYYFMLFRTGEIDTDNYYLMSGTGADVYAGGIKYSAGTTLAWVPSTGRDHYFRIWSVGSLLAGVGKVQSAPAVGTGVLVTGYATLDTFGTSSVSGIGKLPGEGPVVWNRFYPGDHVITNGLHVERVARDGAATIVGTTAAHAIGKRYFEIIIGPNTHVSGWFYGAISLEPPDRPVDGYVGGTPSMYFQSYGDSYVNDDYTVVPYVLPQYAPGDTVSVAVDFDARLIWFRVSSNGLWNNPAAPGNPEAGTGGISFGTPPQINPLGTAYAIALGTANVGNTFTASFKPSARPVGFQPWDDSGAFAPLLLSTLVGVGASTVSASGVVAASAATVVGVGVSSSRSTSAALLPQTSFAFGSGVARATGTGTLQPGIAALAAAGGLVTVGTGVLSSAIGALAGAGVSRSIGTGTPSAGPAALVSTGTIIWRATGTMPAQTASTVALGVSGSVGAGTLVQAGTATIIGTGAGVNGGVGNLTSNATLAGVGTSRSVSTSAALVAPSVTFVAPGVAGSLGTGVLPRTGTTLAATAGAGLSLSTGPAPLAAQAAILAGAGLARHVATGTLTAGVSAVAAAGFSRWAGIGALTEQASLVAGAGLSSSRQTSSALQATVSYVSGFQGVVIVSGTGTMPAQSALIAGVAVGRSLGTGALLAPAATLLGVGLGRSFGTGTLVATTAGLFGSGSLAADASGFLAATPAILSSVGRSISSGTGVLTASARVLAGVGAGASTGTGVLASTAAMTGAGNARHVAVGTLQAQPRTITSVGVARWLASGTLPATTATLSGAALARWAGPGTLPAGVVSIAGSGKSLTTGTVALGAGRSYVSGFQGVVIIQGEGELQAQSRLITSVGGIGRSSGAGTLPVLDPWEIVSRGTSESRGTGVLRAATAAALDGEGSSHATGTGVLPPASVVVAGVAVSRWIVTGTLPAQVADLDGVGKAIATGTGALKPATAALAGAAVSGSVGVAPIASRKATLFGSATLTAQGFGELDAQSRNIVGIGTSRSTGTGAVRQDRPTLAAAGTTGSRGTGTLPSQRVWVYGVGVQIIYGAGVIEAKPATVSGTDLVVGDGVLNAITGWLDGIGEVGEYVIPPPAPLPGGYPGTTTWKGSTTGPTLPPQPWWLGRAA